MAGAVYTIGDGDQPGVLLRQLDFVAGMGFESSQPSTASGTSTFTRTPTTAGRTPSGTARAS